MTKAVRIAQSRDFPAFSSGEGGFGEGRQALLPGYFGSSQNPGIPNAKNNTR